MNSASPQSKPVEKQIRAGQFLFREGEVSKSLFLITKGTLSVRKSKGSEFVELGRIFSGEVVGEVSFFDRAPRSASAIAISDVEVVEISFESMERIYESVPSYFKTIMASLSDRLRKADELIRKLQNETIREKSATGDPTNLESPSAADVLAATADIDFNSIPDPTKTNKKD